MISVVIPLYNKENFISKTIDSVLTQTWKDFELIVVDDGSTDKSLEVIKKIRDPRLRIISQPNSGVSAARNRGINEAAGEFVAFLDADDLWHPDHLEQLLNLSLNYPECSVFATDYVFLDQKGNITPTTIQNILFAHETGIIQNYFEVAVSSHPPLCSSSIMVRKKAFDSFGGFPEGVGLGEDLITWANLACRYKIAYTKKASAYYVFFSQDHRLIPDKIPDPEDVIGKKFRNLVNTYRVSFLPEMAAKWHKMRMVTFLQLDNKTAARSEFKKLKSYIFPTKKDMFWYLMSFFPAKFTNWVLIHK